jgi:hypothetical protein
MIGGGRVNAARGVFFVVIVSAADHAGVGLRSEIDAVQGESQRRFFDHRLAFECNGERRLMIVADEHQLDVPIRAGDAGGLVFAAR